MPRLEAPQIARPAASLILVASLVLGSAAEALAAPPPAEEGARLIVRYRPGAAPADRREVRQTVEADGRIPTDLPATEVLTLAAGTDPEAAAREAEDTPEVLYAEPDVALASFGATPNDPYFPDLWALKRTGAAGGIDAPTAWTLTTGSSTFPIAVVDTGIDATHPDLAPNLWTNPGESGGGRETNGVDDDGNGYVDDVSGWDWVDDDRTPNDENAHGTHVSGTIGARGDNGQGVAGVNWQAGLMPLRVLGADGVGWASDIAAGFRYAAENGARVVNASLGGSAASQTLLDAIQEHPDTLFVVAAGNATRDNDATPTYPCAFSSPNIICVAASDDGDGLASFSNYGATSVDLAAPGTAIVSTWAGGAYGQLFGTSMASPHVAGVAALVWGHHPEASLAEIKTAILSGVDTRAAFAGRMVSGGRLNAGGVFLAMGDEFPDWTGPRPQLSWEGAAFTSAVVVRHELWVDDLMNRGDIDPASTSAVPAEALSHGAHTWSVVAVYEDGTSAEISPSRAILVDALSPSRPTFRRWRRTSPRRVRVLWRASDEGSGLDGAKIRYRRKKAGGGYGAFRTVRRSGTKTTIRMPRRGVWCFQVQALDRVANASSRSRAKCARVR